MNKLFLKRATAKKFFDRLVELFRNIYKHKLSRLSYFWLGVIIECLFLLLYIIEPWRKFGYDFNLVLRERRLFIALVAILMSVLFFYVLAIIKSRSEQPSKRVVFGFSVLFSITMLFVWPNGSSDIFSYIGQGRVMSIHNQNPYSTTFRSLSSDSWLPVINTVWSKVPMIYGPLFAGIESLITSLGKDSLLVTMSLFKLLGWLAFLLTAWAIYMYSKSATILLLFSWNPLVLYESVLNNHNDILVVMFLMLAFLLIFKKDDWSRKYYFLGLFFISMACLIKAIPLIWLPFITVYAIKKEKSIKDGILILLSSIVFVLVIFFIGYYPFWIGNKTFLLLVTFSQKFSNSLPSILVLASASLVNLWTGIWSIGGVLFVFRILFFIFYFYILIKLLVKKSEIQQTECLNSLVVVTLLFYFLFVNWLMPWYFLVLILILVVLYAKTKNEMTALAICLSSLYGIVEYFILK